MRCDRCKHWKRDSDNEEWEAKVAGFNECVAVRERWRITDEASGRLPYGDLDEDGPEHPFVKARIAAIKAARAYVQDGSEYRAELFTAPDFFCALFDPAG